MKKSTKNIKTLSEAIEHLENTGAQKKEEFKDLFGENFEDIKKAFSELKPHLDHLKDKVESETEKTKNEVEVKVKENPWLVLGIVAIVGFIVGCLFTRKRD